MRRLVARVRVQVRVKGQSGYEMRRLVVCRERRMDRRAHIAAGGRKIEITVVVDWHLRAAARCRWS